ncbi:MAG: ChaN family lipoprotein [Bacteroidetes bacterium]|nr:ChaN family lipoprotein [Bacteroidota bacterium]
MKKIMLLQLIVCLTTGFTVSANAAKLSKTDYIIYSTRDGKELKPADIIGEIDSVDVLFFGEEHNDSIGHALQMILFEELYNVYGSNATLSMEMFDRDVQQIMDEYLQGLIKRSYFIKDAKVWSNYKDYEPMVEFAKEKGLSVVCANAPFRYVNIASSKGIDGLMKLSESAKNAMAPLPYTLASGAYADKLNALMGHDPNDPKSKPAYDMIPGQSLWDATMAYSIYQAMQKNSAAKILHLNGRFHTEERFGIVQRLAEFDAAITSKVITLIGDDANYPNVKLDDYKHLGDFVIFTNPAVAKSY